MRKHQLRARSTSVNVSISRLLLRKASRNRYVDKPDGVSPKIQSKMRSNQTHDCMQLDQRNHVR